MEKLLNAVHAHFPNDYTMFLLLSRTGLRLGEVLGLRWGDIDFNGRFINLKRSLSRGGLSTLKGKRERRVDVSLQLNETLKKHMAQSKKKGLSIGIGDIPEYVFTNSVGRFLDKDHWRKRVFYKALSKAELRKVRIHDIRHTYSTLRIAKGDNIADVSNQLGHFSTAFTEKIYYHWKPGIRKFEVDELDDKDFKKRQKAINEK